jgi:protein-disulfide isomerase
VRVVFKNLVVHPQIVTAAHKAGCAAAKQGKFVPFKNAFWEKAFGPYAAQRDQSKLGEANIMVIAKDIGLDPAKLKTDMESPDCQQMLDSDMKELAKFRVNSTPSFFINGKHLGGALPKEQFKAIIDERLKVAEASGVSGADYYEKEIMGKGEKQFRSAVDPKP